MNQAPNQSPFADGFLLMSTSIVSLANTLTTHIDDYRVLLSVLSRAGYGNHVVVNQSEVAKELGMHRPNVNKAVRRLVKVGVLAEKDKTTEKGCKIYTINPEYFWRGSSEQHRSALRKQTQAATGLTVIDGGRG